VTLFLKEHGLPLNLPLVVDGATFISGHRPEELAKALRLDPAK